jgi:hypothetical protein
MASRESTKTAVHAQTGLMPDYVEFDGPATDPCAQDAQTAHLAKPGIDRLADARPGRACYTVRKCPAAGTPPHNPEGPRSAKILAICGRGAKDCARGARMEAASGSGSGSTRAERRSVYRP